MTIDLGSAVLIRNLFSFLFTLNEITKRKHPLNLCFNNILFIDTTLSYHILHIFEHPT